jgi:hypothetical protein
LYSGIDSWFCHASGIIIMTASGSDRPPRSSSSSTLSNTPESLVARSVIGISFFRSLPKISDSSIPSRAAIQLTLPRSVLISPLCDMNRIGWARSHEGNVFVLNRECTIARWLVYRGSAKSGKYGTTWFEVS